MPTDKDAFNNDMKEHIKYNQKIARAKIDLRARLPPRKLKKKELWEYNKTPWQIFKINADEAWRRFDTRSKGMGLMFVLFMGIMVMLGLMPVILGYIETEMNKSKYQESLKTACLDKTFYSWNFKSCEDIDIRPIGDK